MDENEIIKLKLDSLEATPGRNFYLRTLSWGVTALLGGACIVNLWEKSSNVLPLFFSISLIFSWAITSTLLFSMDTFDKLDRGDTNLNDCTKPFFVSIGVMFIFIISISITKSIFYPEEELSTLMNFVITLIVGTAFYVGSLIVCGFLSLMDCGASDPERELERIERKKNKTKESKFINVTYATNSKEHKELTKEELIGPLKELYLFSSDLGANEAELNTFSQLKSMREEGHSDPEHIEQYLLIMGDMKKVIESNPSHKVTLEATEVYNRALIDFALSVNSKYEQINYRDEIDTAREMLDSIDKKKGL